MSSHGWMAMAVVGLWAASSGCTSLSGGALSAGGFQAAEVTPPAGVGAAPPAAVGEYIVELRPQNGKPQMTKRPLSGPLHVQEGLEQTGAHRKFSRNDLELVRALPSGGSHRIPLEWDRANRRVAVEFDYALQPGDRIVVKEDTTTVLDDMMQHALGPLGAATGVKKGFVSKGGRYHVGD